VAPVVSCLASIKGPDNSFIVLVDLFVLEIKLREREHERDCERERERERMSFVVTVERYADPKVDLCLKSYSAAQKKKFC
jgi:hypothetical protein